MTVVPISSKKPKRTTWKFPILETKLSVPTGRRTFVPRTALIKKLKIEEKIRLTVVTAPAGYGKSTLLSEWTRGLEHPTAWLSLDRYDNDPVAFLNYLIAALQTVEPHLGRDILPWIQGQQLLIRPLMTQLLTDLIAYGKEFTLVLDDFHVLTNETIDEIVEFLIEHKPPFVHLVIAGRSKPQLPLAKLRIRNQLVELEAADLSFSSQDVQAFLELALDLDLLPEQVEVLENRTEGWIAGLQLAALSIRGHENATEFISQFAGNNRYIADFLVEEVLNVQSETIQNFLLKTSILESMCGDLCDALLGEKQSQQLLTELDKKDLFLISLDNRRCWFRYHHLFSETLHQLLDERFPELVIELHERASEWYEAAGQKECALRHALKAEDYERFTRLFEQMAERMIARGHFHRITQWIQDTPIGVLACFPILKAWEAWANLFEGNIEKLIQKLEDIQHGMGISEGIPQGSAVPDPHGVLVHLHAIEISLARVHGDTEHMIALAQRDMSALPVRSQLPARSVAFNLGKTYLLTGKLKEADDYFKRAQRLDQAEIVGPESNLIAVAYRSHLRIRQGKLKDAEKMALQGLEMGKEMGIEKNSPCTGFIFTPLAMIHYERNELEAARELAQQILLMGNDGAEPLIYLKACLLLLRLEQAQANPDAVIEHLEQALQIAPRAIILDEAQQIEAWSAWTHLEMGNLAEALSWQARCGMLASDPPDLSKKFEQTILIRLLMAQKKFDEALVLLNPLVRLVEEGGYMGQVIELLILKSLAVLPDGEQSKVALAKALTMAEPEGFIRCFLDEGAAMEKLLVELLQSPWTFPRSFVALILGHFNSEPYKKHGGVE